MHTAIPVVEIAYNTDALRGRSPHGEMNARHIGDHFHMRAELFVDVVVRAFVEEINVHFAQHRRKCVGIPLPPFHSFVTGQLECVGHSFAEASDLSFEKTMLIQAREDLRFRPLAVEDHYRLRRIRSQNPCHKFAIARSDAKNAKWVAVAGFNQRIVIFGIEAGRNHPLRIGRLWRSEQNFLRYKSGVLTLGLESITPAMI